MSNPDYMTAEQVAELLKVDRSYILQQCRRGKLAAHGR
ncbi:MAG: helix-turn-helix domain-containing protein [Polyangiaceae bacterium]|nr:helix-turn-helix domain-containing protein [Polyangiaceae bacterium]